MRIFIALAMSMFFGCSTETGQGPATDCVASASVCSSAQCCDGNSRTCKPAGMCESLAQTCTAPVPIRQGDLTADVASLVGDPDIKFKFRVTFAGSQSVQVGDMLVTASMTHGVHVVQPYFARVSDSGKTPIMSDALSDIDLIIKASDSGYLSPRTAFLDGVAPGTQLAVCFNKIELVKPGVNPACKNLAAYDPAVRSKMVTCAQMCHGGSDRFATGAFNMSPILGTTPADADAACLRTLARSDLDVPAQSLILLQLKPMASGGSPYHPYKLNDMAEFNAFAAALTSWLAGEK